MLIYNLVIGFIVGYLVVFASISLLKVRMTYWDIATVSALTSGANLIPILSLLSIPLQIFLIKKFAAISWGKSILVFLLGVVLFLVVIFSLNYTTKLLINA